MDIVNNQQEFWYELSSKKIGPVTKDQIISLIKENKLNSDNQLWFGGLNDWKKISETEFHIYLTEIVPPPLTGNKVNNTIVWFLAFSPIIGAIIEIILFDINNPSNPYKQIALWFIISRYAWVTGLLTLFFAVFDSIRLSKYGFIKSYLGWAIFFIPVYLWKRATLTKQSRSYFWIGIVSMVLYSFILSGYLVKKSLNDFQNGNYFNTMTLDNPSPTLNYNLEATYTETDKAALDKAMEKIKRDYPNDQSIQKFIFDQQTEDYFYLKSATDNYSADDKMILDKVKEKIVRDSPNDYSVQKMIFNQELEDYFYMKDVPDRKIKAKVEKDYTNEYSIQKMMYNAAINEKNE